jgi:hypothetical protein
LRNFVRRFIQHRSQIPEADKTTIQALIKGITPGPTTSHLNRNKPKSIDEHFHELEEYIKSDEELPSEMKKGKAIEEQDGNLTFKPHETSTTWKTLCSVRTIDQA